MTAGPGFKPRCRMSGRTARDVMAAVRVDLADVDGWEFEEPTTPGYMASSSRALVDGRIEPLEPMWPWMRHFDVMVVEKEMSADAHGRLHRRGSGRNRPGPATEPDWSAWASD